MTQKDTYHLQNIDSCYLGPIPAGATINWIKVWITAATTWLGPDTYYRTVLLVSGNLYYGNWQNPITNQYLPTSTLYTTNPYTGQPWTATELNSIQAGGELQGYKSSNPTYMTAARVEVNFEPGAEIVLEGSLDAQSSLTGDLSADVPLAGSINTQSLLTGDLAIDATLAGSIDSQSSLTGTLTIDAALAGSIDAHATLQGSLFAGVVLSGSLEAQSVLQANLSVGVLDFLVIDGSVLSLELEIRETEVYEELIVDGNVVELEVDGDIVALEIDGTVLGKELEIL